MGNSLAFLMLLLWPVVVVVLFRSMRVERALIWSILGGYLLLPPVVAIDLPMIPPIDKMSIPALSAYVVGSLMLGRRISLLPKTLMARALFVLFLLAPFGTVLTNPEMIGVAGQPPLPGLSLYDAISVISMQAFVVLTWALGRQFLASAAALRELAVALLLGGLIYSVPMLIEIRLSPQINVWVYGFFQHSFEQMMRAGGFRPIVFLEHGLWVAFFAMTTILATLTLARSASGAERTRFFAAAAYLGVVLVLSKSIGALVYGMALAPLVLLLGQRWLIRLAALMAVFALAYPVLRASGHVPVDQLLDLAARFSPERAQSLGFRFQNEQILMSHAFQKPLFGWGGWDRNHVHDIYTGAVITVADGRWIIVLGMFGWAGYIGEFGLLALPLLLLVREAGHLSAARIALPLGALAVIHGVNMIDMLPNATLTPLTWLIAGALLGHAEFLMASRRHRRHPAAPEVQTNAPRTVL